MEITQFQWFRQIIPIQTQIWRELRITSSCRCVCHLSPLLCFNSLCSGASPCNSAGKPEHWAGSSNRGRCSSTQHPFITGIIRIRRSILFNHGTFCSVKTVLSIPIFLLPGYFWLGPHGESALLPVSRSGRGGDSTYRGLDKSLTHFSWNWTHF